MNIQQQNLDEAHELIAQAAIKIEELCQHPEYERIAEETKKKSPTTLRDVLANLKNLLVVVNVQRF